MPALHRDGNIDGAFHGVDACSHQQSCLPSLRRATQIRSIHLIDGLAKVRRVVLSGACSAARTSFGRKSWPPSIRISLARSFSSPAAHRASAKRSCGASRSRTPLSQHQDRLTPDLLTYSRFSIAPPFHPVSMMRFLPSPLPAAGHADGSSYEDTAPAHQISRSSPGRLGSQFWLCERLKFHRRSVEPSNCDVAISQLGQSRHSAISATSLRFAKWPKCCFPLLKQNAMFERMYERLNRILALSKALQS